MISRWFIGVSAKSKGYFKGFAYVGYLNNNTDKCKPSFTKQTALAPCYATEDDAKNGVNEYRNAEVCNAKTSSTTIKRYDDYKKNWINYTPEQRYDILAKEEMSFEYYDNNGWQNKGSINFGWGRQIPFIDFNEEQIKGMEAFKWNEPIQKEKINLSRAKNRINFIDEKLIVRETTIEIKFNQKEKRHFSWSIRSETDTAHSYCCACGGAVPSVPQLSIGEGWGDIKICAICMSKLADEAKRQVEKVSDEIMEHYQADRFIVAMD